MQPDIYDSICAVKMPGRCFASSIYHFLHPPSGWSKIEYSAVVLNTVPPFSKHTLLLIQPPLQYSGRYCTMPLPRSKSTVPNLNLQRQQAVLQRIPPSTHFLLPAFPPNVRASMPSGGPVHSLPPSPSPIKLPPREGRTIQSTRLLAYHMKE